MPPKEKEEFKIELKREFAKIGRKIVLGSGLLASLGTFIVMGDWKGKRESFETNQVRVNSDYEGRISSNTKKMNNMEQVVGIDHNTGQIRDTVRFTYR